MLSVDGEESIWDRCWVGQYYIILYLSVFLGPNSCTAFLWWHHGFTFDLSANNEGLETLDLSWNHLRMKGAVAFSAGLKVPSTTVSRFRSSSLTPRWNHSSRTRAGEHNFETPGSVVERVREWGSAGDGRGAEIQQHSGPFEPQQQSHHQWGGEHAVQRPGVQRHTESPTGGWDSWNSINTFFFVFQYSMCTVSTGNHVINNVSNIQCVLSLI